MCVWGEGGGSTLSSGFPVLALIGRFTKVAFSIKDTSLFSIWVYLALYNNDLVKLDRELVCINRTAET